MTFLSVFDVVEIVVGLIFLTFFVGYKLGARE